MGEENPIDVFLLKRSIAESGDGFCGEVLQASGDAFVESWRSDPTSGGSASGNPRNYSIGWRRGSWMTGGR